MIQRAQCSLVLSLFASQTGSFFVSCSRRNNHRSSQFAAGGSGDYDMTDFSDYAVVPTNVAGISAYEKRTGDRIIRIEKDIDTIVAEVADSQSKVLEQIALARCAQAKRGNANLLERQWETNLEKRPNTFTVAQFNTLAEGLSSGPNVLRPFMVPESQRLKTKTGPKDSYGGFDAVEDPDIVLDFKTRRWRLLEVIVGMEGQLEYDIIAMEEVDRFYGFFAPLLRTFGYAGLFTPKRDSPGSRTGWYSDGCCLFWKESMFELMTVSRHEYKVGTQVYVIVTLKHKPTKKVVVVSVTHLKARASAKNENIRSHQVDELLQRINDEVVLARTKYKDTTPAVLVTGDFNAVPPKLGAGEFAMSRVARSALSSSYLLDDSKMFTTWKIRGPSESKRTIDYIFYGGSVNCVNRLLLPIEDDIGQSRLPSLRFPSDHVHIAAQFEVVS